MSAHATRNGGGTSPLAVPGEWLLLGCERAGKSCLMHALKHAASSTSLGDVSLAIGPTNGVERDTLILPAGSEEDRSALSPAAVELSVVVKEIGGSLASTWSSYYREEVIGVFFVIDVAAPTALSHALVELVALLQQPQLAANRCDFVICLNKTDAVGALSRAELQTSIRIDDLVAAAAATAEQQFASNPQQRSPARFTVVETSAAKGTGMREMLQLMRLRCEQQMQT